MIQTDLYSFSYKKGSVAPWCKRCGNENFHRDGKTNEGKQIRKCKSCKYRFVWCSDLPNRKFFSNVICFATELYSSVGISLREVSRFLMKYFSIQVSYEGIRLWILQAKKLELIDDRKFSSENWNVDETYIKVKGNGFWLWIVYCKQTKRVLAWHISKKRTINDARKVLKRAMISNQNIKPKKIVTDGLKQYIDAIKKEIGWNWRVQKKGHIIDSGIGKNSFVERVNREVKRRTKWFSTFQSLKGAKAFFCLFFQHFNFSTHSG